MKRYELTYLFSPELNETDLQKIEEEIRVFITGNMGEVLSMKTDPAKRDLGDEIKGKTSAQMSSIFFTLDPTHIAGLKKIMKDKDEILRHLLVNKREIEYYKKIERSESRKPSSKVDLKEIDKKIEEILNE